MMKHWGKLIDGIEYLLITIIQTSIRSLFLLKSNNIKEEIICCLATREFNFSLKGNVRCYLYHNLSKIYSFSMMKEMVMEEYLLDITNNMEKLDHQRWCGL